MFTHEAVLASADLESNRVTFAAGPAPADMLDGSLRWLDGPQAGMTMEVMSADGSGLTLDIALDPALQPGARALLREGCDHRLKTCHQRFANAANFQGEPFLPGNDLLARYPTGSS